MRLPVPEPTPVSRTPGDIGIGIRVEPVFYDLPEAGITLLKYRPA